MAVIGTFGSFTAARLGIYASQSSLNVTGNNIANINTKGYTRQRADLVSLYSGGDSRYYNSFNLNIGYGVLVEGVSQLRDPFMDIRYRNEQANVGASETWLESLELLSHTLNEVGLGDDFGVLEKQFNDFKAQLQQLNGAAGTMDYDTVTRSSAEVLCQLLNSYAKALDTVENSQLKNLKEDVKSVNSILSQIRSLNEEIREAGICGDNALELRDQRNVFIDDLSKYVKIEVSYDMEKIDEFSSVERLNINLADTGNPPVRLICGTYGTQLEMPDTAPKRNSAYNFENPNDPKNFKADGTRVPRYVMPDGTLTDDPEQAEQVDNALEGDKNNNENRLWMSLKPLVDQKGRVFESVDGKESEAVELGDNMLYGSLQSMREFLTGKGEFSSKLDIKYNKDATTTRGVPYYRMSLDALAKKFAEEFNKANTKDPDPPGSDPTYDKVFVGYETKFVNGVEVYDLDPVKCTLANPGAAEQPVIDALVKSGLSEDEAKQYLMRTDLSGLSEDLQRMIKNLQEPHLTKQGCGKEKLGGGVLFSSDGDGDNPEGITAANITISKSWSTGDTRILNTKKPNPWDHSTADDNIAHMINLMNTKMDYLPQEIIDGNTAANTGRYFNGTFQERFADMNIILAVDQEATGKLYSTYSVKSLKLENNRQSVSGVDLNDEATNMMMFQKSYSAACQLMTTLDSMLDKLINGTIR